MGHVNKKDDLAKRLRRVEGQVRGIQRMVHEDKYCIDVLYQVSAVTHAVRAVSIELLDGHLATCVSETLLEGGAAADDKGAEASAAISRLVRS